MERHWKNTKNTHKFTCAVAEIRRLRTRPTQKKIVEQRNIGGGLQSLQIRFDLLEFANVQYFSAEKYTRQNCCSAHRGIQLQTSNIAKQQRVWMRKYAYSHEREKRERERNELIKTCLRNASDWPLRSPTFTLMMFSKLSHKHTAKGNDSYKIQMHTNYTKVCVLKICDI